MQAGAAALGGLRVARYRIVLKAREQLLLPPYKGSTMRGAFGRAFRRVSCRVDCGSDLDLCPSCNQREACPYVYVFETPPPPQSEVLTKYRAVPRPFVIEPPLDSRTAYQAGEQLSLGLVLIGRAVELLPLFIMAFRDMGAVGIGQRAGRPQGGRLDVIEVRGVAGEVIRPAGLVRGVVNADLPTDPELEPVVYSSAAGRLHDVNVVRTAADLAREAAALHAQLDALGPGGTPKGGRDAGPGTPKHPRDGGPALGLRFLTPARLKYQRDLATRAEFPILIRNLLRRVSALSYFHCGVRLDMDFRGFLDRAASGRILHDETRWLDWERYSNRQETRMALGGLVGRITYTGDLTQFLPLLVAGAYVHVGKATTFGLGQYVIEVGAPAAAARCRTGSTQAGL